MGEGGLKPGWTRLAFGDLATNITERIDDPSKAGVERYVGLEHLDPESLRIRRWGLPTDVEATKLCFKVGDIIFGKRRVYQRKLAVADFEGICSAHAMVLRANPKAVLSEFLPFFMQSDLFMERAVAISVGSLSPTINWKTLAKEEFALPPLASQQRMVEVLEAFRLADEANQFIGEGSDSLVRSIIADVWIGSANVELRNLVTNGPQNGLYVPASKYGQGIPIVRIDSFYEGRFQRGEWKRVDIDDMTHERYRISTGDLIINRVNSREFVGKAAIVPNWADGFVFESNMMRMTVESNLIYPTLLSEFLNHPFARTQIASKRKDAINQSSVNQDDVLSIVIPDVSIETQDQLIEMIDNLRHSVLLADLRRSELKGMKSLIY